MRSKRIWELDAFRGLCILFMVVIHFVYDIHDLYQLASFSYPAVFVLLKDWGGILFLLLSGICVTLGSRSCKRGLIVFACGLLCTAATVGMVLLGFEKDLIIYFGVLHCLGVCMLLWPLFRRLPVWALALAGLALTAGGYWLRNVTVSTDLFLALGLHSRSFSSSDYFPLLPNLGWFLLGAVIGRTAYGEKKTLFPRVNDRALPLRGLCWCGRHSLGIYLLHQPILAGICMLWQRLK